MPEGAITVEAWAAYCDACDWVSERTFASQTAALARADRHKRWCPARKRQAVASESYHGRHCYDGDDLVCGWPDLHDAADYQEALMV